MHMLVSKHENKASHRLLEEFVPTYSDFEESSLESFKGYKVVEKVNLNYYSVVTGMFRYQRGAIETKSYSSLYKKNLEYYNENLFDKLSIFANKQDAIDSLIDSKPVIKNWSSGNNDLALMEINISGDIKKATFCNKYVTDKDIYVGCVIDSIKEIELL
jgi:hypothetical protein